MSTFLYFLPDAKVCGNWTQIPNECGLENVLDHADFASWRSVGPSGQGMMLSIEPSSKSDGEQAKLGYNPEIQTWYPIEDKDEKITHWLGFEIDHPPNCRDLIRPKVTDGLPLLLKGQPFQIPMVTYPETRISQLPKVPVWKKGGVKLEIEDRYLDLCVRCKKQWHWRRKRHGLEEFEVQDLVMGEFEQWYLAVDILNVNYRIGYHEACALKLINSVATNYIIKYALGIRYFELEMNARKKASAGSDPPEPIDTSDI